MSHTKNSDKMLEKETKERMRRVIEAEKNQSSFPST